MKIMGVKESKGTYEGYDYYNFKLHCLEPVSYTHLLACKGKHQKVLFIVQAGGLAGGAAQNKGVGTMLNLVFNQLPERGIIYTSVRVHGRHKGCAAPPEDRLFQNIPRFLRSAGKRSYQAK